MEKKNSRTAKMGRITRAARRAATYATGIYVALGGAWAVARRDVPQWYMAILLYFSFKIAFKYEKCTLSYIEVKARGVPKEEGILYNFLAGFQDLRGSPLILGSLAAYTFVMAVAFFVVLGKRMVL